MHAKRERRVRAHAGHDVRGAGSCAWGLGAGLSAVRCVDARPGQLAAAGDDGNVMVWEF